jgi:hypothetical protein
MQGLHPRKEPPPIVARIGFFVGVFSLVPCLALVLGPAALILGSLALKARKENPNLPGGHAIGAVLLGSLTSLLNWGFVLFGFSMYVIGH